MAAKNSERSRVERIAAALLAYGWLACAVVGMLVYLPTLGGEFIYDDVMIIKHNERVLNPAGPADYLLTSYWNEPGQNREYRPLSMASYALQHALFGSDPFSWKLVNVLLHGCVCAAGWFLIILLFARPGLATAAMLLFAVHPIHIEAVAGVVGRAELLAALGLILACIAGCGLTRGARRRASLTIAGSLAAALAVGSKDSGVTVFPALLMLPLFVRAPGAVPVPGSAPVFSMTALRRLFPLLTCVAVVITLYLALRIRVLGGIAGPPDDRSLNVYNNPLVLAEGLAQPLSRLKVLALYAGMLVAPFRPSPDYSYDSVPLVRGLADPQWIPGIVILAGWIAGAFAARRQPARLYGLLFIAATFLITSNLFILIGTMLGERLLYLPSLGFCLLLADLLIAVPARARRVVLPAAALWCVALLIRFFTYLPLWNDDKDLFGYTVARVPRSARALQMHAHDLLEANDLDGAMEYFGRSIDILPLPMTLSQYGLGLLLKGRTEEARDYFQRALEGNPFDHVSVSNLAKILAGEGRWDEAFNLYQPSLRAGRMDFELTRDYGRFLQAYGEATRSRRLTEEAVVRLESVIEKHYARDPATLYTLCRAHAELGDREAALRYCQRLLEVEPDNPDALKMREALGSVPAEGAP